MERERGGGGVGGVVQNDGACGHIISFSGGNCFLIARDQSA